MTATAARDQILAYLDARWRAFVEGEGNVDCQQCKGCCRADYAIALSKEEAAHLPHTLVEGHAVILPLPGGRCPLLGPDDLCTVYDHRPVACRQYDCRDMAMASIRLTPDQPGCNEINASIERHYASYGGAIVAMAKQAGKLVHEAKQSGPAAAQVAMVLGALQVLPEDKRKQLVEVLTGQAEAERSDGYEAADRNRGKVVG